MREVKEAGRRRALTLGNYGDMSFGELNSAASWNLRWKKPETDAGPDARLTRCGEISS